MKLSKDILENQLAIDYNCTVEEVRGSKNIYREMVHNEGERPVCGDDTFVKIAVYNQKFLIMAKPELIEWFKNEYEGKAAEWISEPFNLVQLDEKLKTVRQKLEDIHHYYIPGSHVIDLKSDYEVKVFQKDEICQFKDDDRFCEAFLFDDDTPDMIGVGVIENGVILGMAGATADTENMWQVGVNVTEEGKGKGIGTTLISALKKEVEKAGKVPFYGTVESHIKSQKVAILSGFVPVFYEMFSTNL